MQGFAQISKESNKTFSVFNDENAVSKSAKKSDNLTDRDSQTDITGDYGKKAYIYMNDLTKANGNFGTQKIVLKCYE